MQNLKKNIERDCLINKNDKLLFLNDILLSRYFDSCQTMSKLPQSMAPLEYEHTWLSMYKNSGAQMIGLGAQHL